MAANRVESIDDITTEWLESVINLKNAGTPIKVVSFKTSDVVPKGENFTSSLHRYEIQTESPLPLYLVVKLTPNTDVGRGMIQEIGCFPREVSRYQKYLPYLQTQMGYDIGPTIHFGDSWGSFGVLVMEDLKNSGYSMLKPLSCDDDALCGEVVKLLAKLHGVGHKLLSSDEFPNVFESFDFPEGTNDPITEMMSTGMTQAVMVTLEHSPDFQPYAEEIKRRLRFRSEDLFFPVFKSSNMAFQTVIHGDCWHNNMMTRPSEAGSKQTDIKLVDWQLSRVSLGPKELQYFLYSSTDTAFRLRHLETMYRLYYDTYMDALGNPSNDNYSYEKFKEECDREKGFVFSLALVFSKKRLTPDVAAVIDINKPVEETAAEIEMLQRKHTPIVIKGFREVIQEFITMKLF